jgi:hypothetical protein
MVADPLRVVPQPDYLRLQDRPDQTVPVPDQEHEPAVFAVLRGEVEERVDSAVRDDR